jgi:hypothetical protein
MDSGILEKISRSTRYVLKYKKEIERIKNQGRKEGERIGLKKGELNKAVQMAKIMKKEGRKIEEIIRYTKLKKAQIEKL